MNSVKCAFDVSAGNFLGFLVHHRGIEIDENKARGIINALPPMTKKQLQSLLGQINFLRLHNEFGRKDEGFLHIVEVERLGQV